MLLDIIIENKNEILDIFEKYGALNVKIIGSVSRREENDDSDIDFVADLKDDNNGHTDLQAHADLLKELRIYFNRRIELATYQQIQSQYPKALREGVPLSR